MINKVTLVGHLGGDPEVRRLENGAAVAKFSVATNENYKDSMGNWQDRTEWHSVVAWRYLAEKAENSLKKGSLVYIEGKLGTRKWQDQNGNDRYTTDVTALVLKNLSGKDNNSSGGSGYFPSVQDDPMGGSTTTANAASPVTPSVPTETPAASTTNETPIADSADDDLPF